MKIRRGLTLALIMALTLAAGCAGKVDLGGGSATLERLPGFPADRVRVEAVDQRADRSLDPDLAARLQSRVREALAPASSPASGARQRLLLAIVEHTAQKEAYEGRRMTYPRWSAKTVLRAQLRDPADQVLRNWKATGWAGEVQTDQDSPEGVASQAFDQALAKLLKAMAKYSMK